MVLISVFYVFSWPISTPPWYQHSPVISARLARVLLPWSYSDGSLLHWMHIHRASPLPDTLAPYLGHVQRSGKLRCSVAERWMPGENMTARRRSWSAWLPPSCRAAAPSIRASPSCTEGPPPRDLGRPPPEDGGSSHYAPPLLLNAVYLRSSFCCTSPHLFALRSRIFAW